LEAPADYLGVSARWLPNLRQGRWIRTNAAVASARYRRAAGSGFLVGLKSGALRLYAAKPGTAEALVWVDVWDGHSGPIVDARELADGRLPPLAGDTRLRTGAPASRVRHLTMGGRTPTIAFSPAGEILIIHRDRGIWRFDAGGGEIARTRYSFEGEGSA